MSHRLLGLLVLAGAVSACGATPSQGPAGAVAPSIDGSAAIAPAAVSSVSTASGPSPVQSTTGGPVSNATPSPTPAPAFALTSPSIQQGGSIPPKYTCSGEDVSPELAWTGVPDGTQSLVLLLDDPDARDFAHWIAYAIPANVSGLAQDAGNPVSSSTPRGTNDFGQGTNDFGRVGYGGPCPPSGTHHYRFTLYALAAPLGLSGAPRASAVRAALASAAILGKVTLSATYAR